MEDPSDVGKQELEWAQLYARLEKILPQFGKEDYLGHADYFLVDDNWGCCQHKLYITNLKMLAPHIMKSLQSSLVSFPDWEIIVAVDLEEKKSWPRMGLILRPHEIIDDLRRNFFPKEYRGIKYEGSRHGPVLNED